MNTNEIETQVEALLTRICNGVIAYPANLEILKTYSGDSLTNYNVRAHAADAPRLMGKGGNRFRSLRLVCRAAGEKLGRSIALESLVAPITGQPEPFPKFEFNPRWPKMQIQKLLEDTAAAMFRHPTQIGIQEGVGSAILKLTIDPREQALLVEQASEALNNLFKGIGVTNGCQLSLDIGILNHKENADAN